MKLHKQGMLALTQTILGSAENAKGNVFYEGNTDHFNEKNPYRVTTKEVDDFVTDTGRALLGNSPGKIIRHPDTGEIVNTMQWDNIKRKATQHSLSNLSRTLFKFL